jgi:outer membrane protein assembly factor BamB
MMREAAPIDRKITQRTVWSPTSGEAPVIPVGGTAEDLAWETELAILNATAGVMWVDLVPIGPALAAFPTHIGIRAGATETVRLTVTLAQLTRANAPEHRLQASWNVIPPPGKTLRGAARGMEQLKVRMEAPRAAAHCPNPRCGARVAGGATRCHACGAWLVWCPVCGTLNSRLAAACTADSRHRLRSTGPWPCWGGGPEHQGVQRQRAGAALRLRWRSPLPGRAPVFWSAPVCAYGAIYAAGHRAGGESFVVALDPDTGEAYWKHALPSGDPVYPDRGAVAVAGGAVYAATVGGKLIALDAERGTPRWSCSVSARVYAAVAATAAMVVTAETGEGLGRIAVRRPWDGGLVRVWELPGGADSAPTIAEGLILAHAGDGSLLALDPSAVAPRWRARTGGPCDAAPVLAEGRVFSASESGEVRAFALETGEMMGEPFAAGARIGATPGYRDGRLWFGADDGALYSLNRELRLVSRMSVGPQLRSGVALLDDAVVFGADDGVLRVSDGERGVRFEYETGTGARITAGLCAALGAVYFASTAGTLYAMEPAE